jgi:hypothetical protein
MDTHRKRILSEMKRIRKEIEQIFVDAESWNENARPDGEPRIDPDPTGQLEQLVKAIDRTLEGRDL